MDKFEEEQLRKEEKMLDILRRADKVARKTTFGPTDYRSMIRSYDVLAEYRAIGTLEECRKSVEICKAMIERNVTPENMEEYMKFEDECVKHGFAFDSLLKAREKQTPEKIERKPATDDDVESELRDFITREGIVYRCPTCGYCIAVEGMKYCWNCGQKIDWSESK